MAIGQLDGEGNITFKEILSGLEQNLRFAGIKN